MKRVVYLYQDQFAEIERPAECHLDYIDYDGKKKILKLMDF